MLALNHFLKVTLIVLFNIIQHYENTWRFTGFYGNPVATLRHVSWDLLRRIYSMNELVHLPWLIGGDFNEIMFIHDKQGGSMRFENQMKGFMDVIENCGLVEFMHYGNKFTWCSRRLDNYFILERLDRFFASNTWNTCYPFATASNLEFYGSDHRPILITLCPGESGSFQKRSKRFYFEHKWFLEEEFPSFLNQSWNSCGTSYDLPTKLQLCQAKLKS